MEALAESELLQFGQEGLVLCGHRRRIEAGADKADPDDLARLLCARREWPRRRAAQQRDELATFQLIKLHSVPASQGRIAGYRTGEDQSAGFSQPCRTSQPEHQLRSSDELASERPENDG